MNSMCGDYDSHWIVLNSRIQYNQIQFTKVLETIN